MLFVGLLQEARLLERLQQLKLHTVLPAKLRLLLAVHGSSEQLGAMLEEIFQCVGELVAAKVEVIEQVGEFVETKVTCSINMN